MTWVTCQSATSNETFAVNSDHVRKVIDRKTSAVLEFADSTRQVIVGGLESWMARYAGELELERNTQ